MIDILGELKRRNVYIYIYIYIYILSRFKVNCVILFNKEECKKFYNRKFGFVFFRNTFELHVCCLST